MSSYVISAGKIIPIVYDADCPEHMKCTWTGKVTEEERERLKQTVAAVSENGVEWLKCSSPPTPEFHDSSTPSPEKQKRMQTPSPPAQAPAMQRSQSEPN